MLLHARKKLRKQRPCVYSEHIRFLAESDTSPGVAHNLLASGAIVPSAGIHYNSPTRPFRRRQYFPWAHSDPVHLLR